jgi:drug/metabolite transporter (DMT)-like permease
LFCNIILRLPMEKQSKAYICAISAVLLWSTVASAFKITLRHMDSLQMLLGSSAVSLVFLFVVLISRKKLYLLASYSWREYLASLLLGFLNPFLYYVILFKAYSILTAQEALALNYIWPIMLVILSIPLLRQPITLKSILALVISFSGVFIIATGGDVLGFRFTNPAGVALALSSTVVWALYWIFNVRDRRDETAKLFLNFAFGFVLVLTATMIFSSVSLPGTRGLIGIAYIGLFEMGVAFVLWLQALRLSETAAQVSNFVYISPFLSLVFIHLIVGERIAPSTIIGLVFIITGILVQHYAPRNRAIRI